MIVVGLIISGALVVLSCAVWLAGVIVADAIREAVQCLLHPAQEISNNTKEIERQATRIANAVEEVDQPVDQSAAWIEFGGPVVDRK